MNEPTADTVRSEPDLEETDPAPPPLLDWVPASEPEPVSTIDYPIEGGVPHPHWVREPAEHHFAAHPVVIRESAAVVRLLVGFAVAAFLLGMAVFYPVSPLGR